MATHQRQKQKVNTSLLIHIYPQVIMSVFSPCAHVIFMQAYFLLEAVRSAKRFVFAAFMYGFFDHQRVDWP